MSSLPRFRRSLPSALLAAMALTAGNAHAVGQLADVAVIDRATGQTLPVHYYRGEYWVAGTPGAKYAVSVANASGGRVLAVMSVDGVNVLNGQTASVDQSGYVFNGYQRYEVTGWRKSNHEVAAFEFVASPASYAERTGRPANVGVIGVALFKERYTPPAVIYHEPQSWGGRRKFGAADSGAADTVGSAATPHPAAPPSAAASPAPSSPMPELAKRAESSPSARQEVLREKLGTGHGERERSDVQHTAFERAQTTPNETIRIRYDSRENLIAMGVIRERYPFPHGPRQPNPFPDSLGFVPDPPRHWR
ncbi:MAG: hypothetical protein JNL19_03755 [Burkholderiales bacterium]|nr:hypothetical protein [Burkholderiales bacterium]